MIPFSRLNLNLLPLSLHGHQHLSITSPTMAPYVTYDISNAFTFFLSSSLSLILLLIHLHSKKNNFPNLFIAMLLIYAISFFLFRITSSNQFYDSSSCSAAKFSPGSRYTCDEDTTTQACDTFLVYRAQKGFDTISEIANLFDVLQDNLLIYSNVTDPFEQLEKDREVVIPIQCGCFGGFFLSNVSFQVSNGETYSSIACEVFEGLVKTQTLAEDNHLEEKDFNSKVVLNVPLRCACPDRNDTRNGIYYLVTYPIVEFDGVKLVSEKFGVSSDDIWEANNIIPFSAVFPNTTVLVPLTKQYFYINYSITVDPSIDVPSFIPMITNEGENGSHRHRKKFYAIGSSVGGSSAVLLLLLGLGYYQKARAKHSSLADKHHASTSTRTSTTSCLSPDLIAGMSKYSLISYAIDELSEATNFFSEDTKLGASVHKGCFAGTELVIKRMEFRDACRVINIHSIINHTNIVHLEGVCYGDDECPLSYLVYEFASNGCLRDCMKNKSELIPWHRRTQIAFDVAVGLHYIHHCTIPSYIHMNINSKNILITRDWRAKIANLGEESVVSSHSMETSDVSHSIEEWIAPEYLRHGLVSPKVDVFAFGVVLFELLIGQEVKDGGSVKESLGFLSGKGSVNGCFDKLRELMDSSLRDSPIGEALCVTVLAKACIDDDPLHRPSMNDILMILARMVR
ncbi:hypothetical protein J5N97_024251 [Dioscorea zingiberensis]|uniref:Uncharacterized protein n=1 Tax=Dioscorea zingiberensis TaxID=325984 RepID=A0A9D5C736_9LILI|nr:hypothetical protein J5N97_024251 [Dioscorea zingiberensis]